LVDYRFITLPFEQLEEFQHFPLKSKDFSAQVFFNRICPPTSNRLEDLPDEFNPETTAICTIDKPLEPISHCLKSPSVFSPPPENESPFLVGLQTSLPTVLNRLNPNLNKATTSFTDNPPSYQSYSQIFTSVRDVGAPKANKGVSSVVETEHNLFLYHSTLSLSMAIQPSYLLALTMTNQPKPPLWIIFDRVNTLKTVMVKPARVPTEETFGTAPVPKTATLENFALSVLSGAKAIVTPKLGALSGRQVEDSLRHLIEQGDLGIGNLYNEFRSGKTLFAMSNSKNSLENLPDGEYAWKSVDHEFWLRIEEQRMEKE
jgi:hypothetical protein